jgi:hypothetical protein
MGRVIDRQSEMSRRSRDGNNPSGDSPDTVGGYEGNRRPLPKGEGAGLVESTKQSADWFGSYRFEDDPQIEGTCQIVDISQIGIGVELFGDTPFDPVRHRLAIDVQNPSGRSLRLHMEGQVRNITLGSNGGVRVGVEFGGLTEMEQAILSSLERMHVAS